MVARIRMSFCKSVVFLTLGLINCCNCHVKWRLEQTFGNQQKLQNIGDRLWTTRSTFGRVFCAVLCFQNNDCSFYEHQDNTCLGYKSTEPRAKKLNMMTCNQGNFKKYIENGVPPTVGSSCDTGEDCTTSDAARNMSLSADEQGSVLFKVMHTRISHSSGLAASRVYDNILYTINDGNLQPQDHMIYAIDLKRGKEGNDSIRFELCVSNAVNNDWAALAIGPCKKESCIYIGDIGTNPTTGVVRNYIYRLKEPETNEILTQRTMKAPGRIQQVPYMPYMNRLSIRWSGKTSQEGACLMVDPTGDAYIISTAEGNQRSRIAKIPSSCWERRHTRLKPLALLSTSLTEGSPVACDLSHDGKEMLVKFTSSIYYWSVPDRDYGKAMKEPGRRLPFTHQANVKAVAWSHKGDGYYTLPEGWDQYLSYHKLK